MSESAEYGLVGARVAEVRERIEAAARRSGRDPAAVTLMAVTKFHPREAVEAAWEAGVRVFGESRVQEAEAKFQDFLEAHPGASLELIGTLQSNKARRAAALFSRVQSVDSLSILAELDKRARQEGRVLDILLELHTGEESKAGFPGLDALLGAAEVALGSGGLRLRGLMTMAPYTPEEGPVRASFWALRAAFDEVSRRFPSPCLDTLSMGMTNDYAIAVEEGSTLVRVGTAIFGSRAMP